MPQSSWRIIASSLGLAARGAMRSVSLVLALILLANNCLPQTVVNSQQLQQQQQSQLPQAIITASDVPYQEQQSVEQQQQPMEAYPHYMQSPLAPSHNHNQNQNQNEAEAGRQQRSNVRMGHLPLPSGYMKSTARSSSPSVSITPALATAAPVPPATTTNDSQRSYSSSANNNNNYQYEPVAASPPKPAPQPQPQPQSRPQAAQTSGCLYDKQYFLKLDQCLERRPYPTIGLPAFKNDDLVVKKGLSDKYGCSFILTNGLFKSFQVSRYSLDSDTQCLDQDQTSQLSVQFSNVTLYYLWQLRCLNYANQLLHDATLDGKTLSNSIFPNDSGSSARSGHGAGNNGGGGGGNGGSSGPICVGSSQSFGFAALQLSNIEAQVELSIDIYKNWRVTNVTVAMMSPGSSKLADHQQAASNPGDYSHEQQQQQSHTGSDRPATSIKEFTFDTIDGDELNWRYSHLYENWTRNRLHVNFLDQFKRFLWVSLQRCLSESSERLPVKLNDLFASHKYY